jgi:hypothetical protein
VHDLLAVAVHEPFEHGMPVAAPQGGDEIGIALRRRAENRRRRGLHTRLHG